MAPFSDDDLERYYRTVEARTAAIPNRLRRRPRPHPAIACPTPGKDAYRSEGDARAAIDSVRRHTGPRVALRVYHCECRSWHITSSPPRPERAEPRSPTRGRRRSGGR